jgi:hypothetical protein
MTFVIAGYRLVLVPATRVDEAVELLRRAGHAVTG